MTNKKKITLIVLVSVFVVMAAIVAYFTYDVYGHFFKLPEGKKTYIYIDSDDNEDSVKAKITEAANPSRTAGFKLASKLLKFDKCIHTGRYGITSDCSYIDVLRNIRIHQQDPVDLVVPSVRTVNELAGRLTAKLMLDSAEVQKMLTDEKICNKYGYNPQTIHCLIIPNTYQVYWDITAEKLLARLEKEKDSFWNKERENKAHKIGLTPVEVATLASIVESETSNNGEKARVAGLYMNRLNKGMLLQSDPTVIYGIGDFSIRRVLNYQLAYDSPYNTYKYQGLPPGPIRIPTIAGIDAVLNYEHHPYLYMCAKEDFSGTHNFAVSFSEHQQNARRYVNALNSRGIKK